MTARSAITYRGARRNRFRTMHALPKWREVETVSVPKKRVKFLRPIVGPLGFPLLDDKGKPKMQEIEVVMVTREHLSLDIARKISQGGQASFSGGKT